MIHGTGETEEKKFFFILNKLQQKEGEVGLLQNV